MTRFTDRLERKVLQTADAIQVENAWMFDYVREVNAGRDAMIRYVPPGVDAWRFRPAGSRDLQSDPYILCVGRLDDPRKNIDLLLEAFARLPSGLKVTVRLVLAGLTGPKASFWARVNNLCLTERVDFIPTPDTATLVRLYQGASVFVLCSDEEGLGIVILEAMSCGVPIVSTRSGGPEGIINDGREGYLVPLGDAAAIADRMASLLRDQELNRRMGEAARETIMDRYEASVAGKAFLDIYSKLLSLDRAAQVGLASGGID
jgi:glycosyltransferase involved in cell wall biosynthesis